MKGVCLLSLHYYRGKNWAFRVLRWLLVIDPEVADISEIKKCFLMAVPTRQFYLNQLEIGLEQLVEKILFLISVEDESLLVNSKRIHKERLNILIDYCA